MTSEEYCEVVPEASRIMEGLRDTGYDYPMAVADIIDNSIAAAANMIVVSSLQNYVGDIRVTIADNGVGMTKDELIDAMRYGSKRRSDVHSLGKFGLGLKTGSTACCRRLKVISRKDGEVSCAIWDLDRIAETGSWLLILDEPTRQDLANLDEAAAGQNGTLVVWENCDRILSARFSNPTTSAFKKAFAKSNKVLRHYIGMVHQRFLDPEDNRAQNVTIVLNSEAIKPWDPFCRELNPDYGNSIFECCEEPGAAVKVTAFIVPPSQSLATKEERQRVMPDEDKDLKVFTKNSLSGFYVYRENRLIHWGDWFGMPGIDFHHRLCRFELDFNAKLDELFQVDIKKSRILLNPDLQQRLLEFAGPIKFLGAQIYRQKERKSMVQTSGDIHAESNTVLASRADTLTNATFKEVGPDEAQITNQRGTIVVPYGIENNVPADRSFVEVTETTTDGVLWQPAIINGKPGVMLNSGHDFYKRFYGANKDNPVAIQAIDYLFWVLSQTEAESLDENAVDNLTEARYEASHKLRKLAKELPDVNIEELENQDA